MDGYITIGTKLDTSKFDRQITELENKAKREEEKASFKIKAQVQTEKELKEHKQEIFDLEQEYNKLAPQAEKYYEIVKKLNETDAITAPEARYIKDLESTGIIQNYEKMGSQLDKMYAKEEQLNTSLQRKKFEYQGIIDKVSEYRKKIEDVNSQKQVFVRTQELKAQEEAIAGIKGQFNGVGSSIQDTIHKISKMALGIFGIRSAFMAVRRASSELASYNPQYASNIEYIRYALTQAIAPILEYIVGLAKKVLAYIAYIAKAWFGVNIFANASAESFKKVKTNLGGANKQAKELQKTLAGFDEMNILNKASTGGGGGIGDTFTPPDFDLSNLEDIEIPDWIKWIADNKDLIVGAIEAIATAFLAFKTLGILKLMSGLGDGIWEVAGKLSGLNKVFLGLGIAMIIIGIYTAIESLIKWMKEPTWDNFEGVLYGLSTAVTGLGIALLALNKSNPFGWVLVAIGIVTTLVTALIDMTTTLSDEERKTRAVKEAEEELKKAREELTSAANDYISAVDRAEDAEKKLQEAQDKTGISIDDLLKKMQDENLTYKDLDENEREVYKAYMNNKDAQEQLKTATDNMTTANENQQDKLNKLIGVFKSVSDNTEDYKNKIVDAYENGQITAEEAAQAISVALNDMDDETRRAYTEDIPDAIKDGLDPNKYQSAAESFKRWWSNTLEDIQRKSTGVFGGISGQITSMLSDMGNINFGSYGASTGGYVTKMASGGLVNMPNRGVPVASAIAGEAGREGIIPLTDEQAMSQLGAEIGRNVLVNLTNITTMNGRVISRELKNIQSDQDFAYNM